jgi:hypothetical protein
LAPDLKNRILLENYYLPGDLENQIEAFVANYNHRRYHESIDNLTPADVYFGRGQTILLERERIKRKTIQNRRLLHRRTFRGKKAEPGSKQSRVIAMLQSPAGATIAAMMQATGWQQHSVRGFLAGVVRKRLKLKLGSKKVDETRVYRVATGDSGKPGPRRSKRQSS